ncbi:MAG: phenylacetate-CoA oxygenase subunit PaaJ [Microbacteriaceae bacterium]|nr:phenylacetate-CoA oxygenase subunit PaaJ [Microbacteriaceae bacterium]
MSGRCGTANRTADRTANRTAAWAIAAQVVDPEIPVLTIEDLGVLRSVEEDGDRVRVELTPTYSGCPAIDAMRDDVRAALQGAGYREVDVRMVLSPAWSTDWMSDAGKAKLREFGIAPPNARAGDSRTEGRTALRMAVKCPRCHSLDTRELARFGSTSCKALYVCDACLEPFDFFKVL